MTTLESAPSAVLAKTILSREGVTCALLALAPADEISAGDTHALPEQILFVVDGQVTVRFGDVNTIVNKDEALHLAAGREHAIAAHPSGWAKVLRIELPTRRVVAPIVTFPNS